MILYYKILKFKHVINNIAIGFLFSKTFANIKNIKRKCNLIINVFLSSTEKSEKRKKRKKRR